MKKMPGEGGCWFCWHDDEDGEDILRFDWEFDTYYHIRCLEKTLRRDPSNKEARIIYDAMDDDLKTGLQIRR